MTRKVSINCDGCGKAVEGPVAEKMGSEWSTVEIFQRWPGIIDKPGRSFDLCPGCSSRVMPVTWSRYPREKASS